MGSGKTSLGASVAALVVIAACCAGGSLIKNNWNEHSPGFEYLDVSQIDAITVERN